jgi:hypothetical protein
VAALGKKARLSAVWGGEHDGVLSFAGGAVVGELELAGVAVVFPLRSSLSGLQARTVSATRARTGVRDGPRASWAVSVPGPAQFQMRFISFSLFCHSFK